MTVAYRMEEWVEAIQELTRTLQKFTTCSNKTGNDTRTPAPCQPAAAAR